MKWTTRNTPTPQKWAHYRRQDETIHGTHNVEGQQVRPPREGRLAAPIVTVEVDRYGRIINPRTLRGVK